MIHTTLKPSLVPESERALDADDVGATLRLVARSRPGDVPDRLRAGLDVWRPGGRPRRRRPWAVLGAVFVARAQGGLTIQALRDVGSARCEPAA